MPELVAFIKEHGDHLYIQAPVIEYKPEADAIAALTYSDQTQKAAEGSFDAIKEKAPNPRILWLQGRYVEADNANRNGDQWTAGDLAIKKLTPVFMPITVMHDMRTAVGTIADTRLRLPKDDPEAPRARIETILALWSHRFPDVAAEALTNAQQGTLMQSMECISHSYDCSVCGQVYTRLPKGAERKMWCAHLRGEELSADQRPAARILRDVTFTGTGLIFGTRGARGAYPEAFLEVEALAEMFAEAHTGTAPKRTRSKNFMEIEDSKYAELVAQAEVAKKVPALETAKAEAESKVEEAEAAKVKAEQEAKDAKERAEAAEEKAAEVKLRDDRLAKLGTAFTAKLDKMETTKTRLHEQAAKFTDEEWAARLAELEEVLDVKVDAKLDEKSKGKKDTPAAKDGEDEENDDDTAEDLFSTEHVARAGIGAGDSNGDNAAPTPAARQSVMSGLVRPRAAAKS